MRLISTRRLLPLIAAMLLSALVLAACGDDDGDSDGTTAANGSGGGGDLVAEAQRYIEENAPGARELPDSAPKPPEKMTVWAIPCASAASGCQDIVTGVEAAGKVLGWEVKTFDGQGDPARWAAGINQAVAAGADAIVTASIDCAPVKASLQKARKAGVITINTTGFDCDSVGGQKLFSSTVAPAPNEDDWKRTAEVSGALQAAWAIAKHDGDVKAIHFTNEEQELTIGLGAGFRDYLQKCDTCEIVKDVPFQLADLGDPLTQKASSALLASSDANVAVTPYDPAAAPVAQAVVAAGKAQKVQVVGAIGAPLSLELIRDGRGQAMSVGWDVVWLGWAAMDDIIRIANDQEPVYSGWALGIVDADSLPKGNQYHGPADYESNYEQIWKGQ